MNIFNFSFLFLPGAIMVLLFSGCAPEKDKINAEISALETGLYNDTTFVPDKQKAAAVLALYDDYISKFPEDTLSAAYLFKAGDISSKINNTSEAIQYFDHLKIKYPSHRNAPYAIFLQGFIMENQVGDPAKAKPYYEEFLRKFPDHVIAADVSRSIENLGKSPEELIADFESRLKSDSISSLDSASTTAR